MSGYRAGASATARCVEQGKDHSRLRAPHHHFGLLCTGVGFGPSSSVVFHVAGIEFRCPLGIARTRTSRFADACDSRSAKAASGNKCSHRSAPMSRRRPPPLQHMSVCAYGEISFSRVPNFVSPQLLTHNRPRFVCKIVYSWVAGRFFGSTPSPGAAAKRLPFRSAAQIDVGRVSRNLQERPLRQLLPEANPTGGFGQARTVERTLRPDAAQQWHLAMRRITATRRLCVGPAVWVAQSWIHKLLDRQQWLPPDARPLHAYKETASAGKNHGNKPSSGRGLRLAVLPRRDARRVSVPIR